MALKRAMPHVSNYGVEKYKYVYLPLQAWGGWVAVVNASDQADIAVEDAITSAGTGAPSFGEITDSGIVGLHVDDTADSVGILWPIPYDCDVKSKIEFAVTWCSDQTTTTDTVTWKVLYTELTINSEAIEAGATALNTAIAADTNVAAVTGLQQTAWGVLNGGTLTGDAGDAPRNHLALDISHETESGADATSDAIHAIHLIIRYVRRTL